MPEAEAEEAEAAVSALQRALLMGDLRGAEAALLEVTRTGAAPMTQIAQIQMYITLSKMEVDPLNDAKYKAQALAMRL